MSTYRRHGLMAAGEESEWKLIHHWSGEDELITINGQQMWEDRVGGDRFIMPEETIREADGYRLLRDVKAKLDGGSAKFPLGYHYKVELDAEATALPDKTFSVPYIMLADFSSLGGWNYGFMCAFCEAYKKPSVNDKRHSVVFPVGSFITKTGVPTDGIFEFACVPYDDTQDIWRFRYNQEDYVYTTKPHAQYAQNEIAKQNVILNCGNVRALGQELYTNDILYRGIKIYTENK